MRAESSQTLQTCKGYALVIHYYIRTMKTIINYTPTGMIPQKSTCPNVPISSAEIVEQVHKAYELGISMVHVHARKEDGTPTAEAKYYAPILEGIRDHCPGLVVCTSLSGRNVPDPVARAEVLSLRPDMGSLTLSSLNFPKSASLNAPDTIAYLAREMELNGVNPELEVFDLGMMNYLNYLRRKGQLKPPYYINIILGNISGAQNDPASIAALLRSTPDEALVSLGGIGKFQLDTHLTALAMNLGVRIGLEDNIYFDRKRDKLASNIGLLERLHELISLAEREHMSHHEFGKLGFYNFSQPN